MDLRRLAYLPLKSAWFPQIDQPGSGIKGRAPKALQRQLIQLTAELLDRHKEGDYALRKHRPLTRKNSQVTATRPTRPK
jgi:hypothetical protein